MKQVVTQYHAVIMTPAGAYEKVLRATVNEAAADVIADDADGVNIVSFEIKTVYTLADAPAAPAAAAVQAEPTV